MIGVFQQLIYEKKSVLEEFRVEISKSSRQRSVGQQQQLQLY